jgi:hypothetical protein
MGLDDPSLAAGGSREERSVAVDIMHLVAGCQRFSTWPSK